MERGLQVTLIWKDNDMVEARLSAWNGEFGGIADMYLSYGELTELADSVNGFPKGSADDREFKLGDLKNDGSGGALLHLHTVDLAGHATIALRLLTGGLRGSAQSVTLHAPVQAAAVDNFVSELRAMNDEVGPIAFLPFNL